MHRVPGAISNAIGYAKLRSQLFICTHNEALSVVAMCVSIQNVRPLESIAETRPQLVYLLKPVATLTGFEPTFEISR
jgi:hypothetical protein